MIPKCMTLYSQVHGKPRASGDDPVMAIIGREINR